MSLSTTQIITRGATVQFTTNFYDVNGVPAQPDSATINIVYSGADGSGTTVEIAMTPPAGQATAWTALFDTRGIPPQPISWSIHTGTNDPAPVTVEDGSFQLAANQANLLTF